MSEFLAKSIFNNKQVEAQLGRMFFEIGQAFPELDINSVFCLTGRAAAELQGAAAVPSRQIVFLAADAALYAWIQSDLPDKLANNGVLKFVERTVFYLPGCVLEVWFEPEAIDVRLYSGIYVQFIDDINEILL